MPNRAEMENVAAQIGSLESSRFIRNGDSVMPVLQGEPSPDAYSWSELTPDHRIAVMETWITWDGFDREQELDVIENVVGGKGPGHWMDGVQPSDRMPSTAPPDPGLDAIISELEKGWAADREQPYAQRDSTGPDPAGAAPGDSRVRPLTEDLILCCQLDTWPKMPTVVDFGIDSSSHLGALQYAIREELVTPQELDAAMGNGPRLTEIAQRGDNPYRDVAFRTAWDDLTLEPQGQGDYDRILDRAIARASHQILDKDRGGPER